MAEKKKNLVGQVLGGVALFFVIKALLSSGDGSTGLRLEGPERSVALQAAEAVAGTTSPNESVQIPAGTLELESFDREPDLLGGVGMVVVFTNKFDVPMKPSTFVTCRLFDPKGRRIESTRVSLPETLAPGESMVVTERVYIGSADLRVGKVSCGFESS